VNVEQVAGNRASFTLTAAAEATAGEIIGAEAPAKLQLIGVSTDTRALTKGSLFVALRGERFDGHNFLQAAFDAGARAAVVEQIEGAPPGLALIQVNNTLAAYGALAAAHRRRFHIPVVAITGSYGKTTTRALTVQAMSVKYNVLAPPGNFNNEIGVPQTLLQLDETHDAAVIEMGMRGSGQIEYLAQIAQPTVGVITNIGPQHIELLGSLDAIAAAKAELLPFLPASGIAVLPADSEYLELLKSLSPCRVLTFGESEAADYRVSNITADAKGNVVYSVANSGYTMEKAELPLPGRHNATNAAAALAVAGALRVHLMDAGFALEGTEVPGARMRVIEANGITIIDDCYNAGPDSMRAALETLRDFPGDGRRVAVLGAMRELGEWTASEHRKIGELAATCAEVLIGVADETRDLLEAAQAVGSIPFHTDWRRDAEGAAERVRELVRPGDIVLVKGSRSVGLETVVSALDAA